MHSSEEGPPLLSVLGKSVTGTAGLLYMSVGTGSVLDAGVLLSAGR